MLLRIEYFGFDFIRLKVQPATLRMSLSSANIPVMPLHLTDGFLESLNSRLSKSRRVRIDDTLTTSTIIYFL